MKTGALVLALAMAGAVGGAAGALLVQAGGSAPGTASAPAPAAGSGAAEDRGEERRAKEVADLRNRIEVLEASVANASSETARLREEMAAAAKASGEARERILALEARPAAPEGGVFPAGARRIEPGGAVRIEGPPLAAVALAGFRKAAELRALPLEERWTKAREELGLTTTQEEELKAALKERDEGMQEVVRAALQAREEAARDGSAEAARGRAFDLVKMQEVRKRYDDRVAQTLNADQQKKWKEEGYDRAMGGGVDVVTAVRFDNAPAEK